MNHGVKKTTMTKAPAKNGKAPANGRPAVKDERPGWSPAFSNYAGDVPLGIDEILRIPDGADGRLAQGHLRNALSAQGPGRAAFEE